MAHHHLAGTGDNMDDETAAKWGVIDRLTTRKRLRSSLFDDGQQQLDGNNGDNNKRVIDVTKLGALERHVFIEKLIQRVELDNLHLLQKIRTRIDKVGIELPSIEVRYDNLHIQTECQVVRGKALPTLWNSFKSVFPDIGRIPGFKSRLSKITIINGVSGIIKPGRMTLLLGPPGCGKTTLLRALSGNLSKSLEVSGDISYNGYELTEFVPQKTSAYISQYDLHIGEMTVRETLDFSLCCQGVGSRAELIRREKEAGVHPDPDVDVYMKATSVEGQKTTLQTDYILRILGLDTCADTLVGDVMSRGISGGEKRRLTTGEMIVGPTRALFMDEISNGLDSATTYQIVAFLQQLSHITDATILVSLLQPAPETFDLFDDVILMGEGKVVYHGPRSQVLEFFESCGFRCPERKGIPDFLQEVISRKDQAQYWHSNEDSYRHISIDAFSRKYRESSHGKKILDELSSPFPKSKSHKDAVTFTTYSFSKWELLKTCSSREFLIMKRNSFTYIFKSVQIAFNALVVMTLFLRTMMKVDLLHANYYMGALFYAVTVIVINGFPEIPLTVARLPIFYKHRDLSFYPTWVYVIPSAILKIPHSLLEAAIFTCLTYYVSELTNTLSVILPRFFGQLVILFLVHLASTSMYRFIASLCRNVIVGTAAGSLFVVYNFLFSGFLIPRTSIPDWLKWGFWACPSTYGEIAINVNEFLAPRWKKMLPSNITTGQEILSVRGLKFDEDFFWISLGALLGFTLLFNIGWTLALSFLHSTRSRPIISWETFSQLNKSIELDGFKQAEKQSRSSSVCIVPGSPETGSMVLPFVPLAVVFRNLQYYVDTPLLLLLKSGGRMIYCGPLGLHSNNIIKYFEVQFQN
ncbi:OLC1v1007147C1 [Oldenlandia corymbosa var. corymbosa]|uniref:OLC1v1007147C1 n=1 Tax=Oldenlandia corymbosa var. corymbosa TaxID=529605 RepID=A0AAV1DL10_OLDCO|nr:OLC1v1007147C1 [Oldenlandia corymbosa var. corymbosa]